MFSLLGGYIYSDTGEMLVNERENKCENLSLTSRRSMELDHKLIESTEDGDLVLALNADGWLRKRQHKEHEQQKRQGMETISHTLVSVTKMMLLWLNSLCLGRGQTWDQ